MVLGDKAPGGNVLGGNVLGGNVRGGKVLGGKVLGGKLTFGNAVREGSTRRPQGRYAHLSTLNGGTDAIGAAADAVGELERLLRTKDYGPLQKRWPVLTFRVKHPLRKDVAPVQSIVHNLNDQYLWTREAIAAFVDGVDVGVASTEPVPAPRPTEGRRR